jgi:FtsH-binding integral membrane protein
MFSKNIAAKMLLVVIVGSSFLLPLVASASSSSYTTPNIWGTPPGYWGPLVSCTGNYLTKNSDGTPTNPCTSLCDLIDTFINIVYFGMSIAIFIIAPIMVVVGGVMILMAGANPGMLESGRKAITAAVVGLIIVLCAYLIVNTFITVLSVTGVGGFGNNSCTTSS